MLKQAELGTRQLTTAKCQEPLIVHLVNTGIIILKPVWALLPVGPVVAQAPRKHHSRLVSQFPDAGGIIMLVRLLLSPLQLVLPDNTGTVLLASLQHLMIVL